MTLKKGFLRPNLGITFTTKSIIRSTIIGVLVSFSLYAFAFYVFETLRVHPALSTMRLYIYPDQEMSLYKWFFAATSLIIGQAVATKLLFRHQNRKKTTATKTRLRVLNIQNDQTTQPTYFLHWLSSILIYFGLLINLSPTFWSYSEIDFYANYRCLFYLIPLVLWLSLWNGFLRLYKQKTYKWMVLSFITLGVLSFGLSKINLVDYNGFNENYIKNRPVLQYTYNLPSSEFSQKNERKSRIIKFYIGYKKSETNPQPTILYNEESDSPLLRFLFKKVFHKVNMRYSLISI